MTFSAAFVVPAAQATARSTVPSFLPATPLPSFADVPSLISSSSNVAVTETASFEPVLPSTPALIGMGSVIVLCVIAAIVWSEQVVPVSRTKLALSKRKGQVKKYLEELEESGKDEKPLETWLFTDWLQQARNTTSTRKEPALPILKSAKWNSGDNPVVVTSAMLMVGMLVAAITERVAS